MLDTETIDLNNLPADVKTLHEIIKNLQKNCQAIIDEANAKINTISQQYENLRHQMHCLIRGMYGRKSEKNKELIDKHQMQLFAEEDLPKEEQPEIKTETITYQREKPKRNGRKIIPDNLPRVRVEYDIPEEEKKCDCGCGSTLRKIGEEISEQLERIPAKIFVIQHVRFKYAGCPHDSKIVTAKMPEQPIDKGLAGPGLLADVLIKKYDDHLPLYRQEEIFARDGINIPRSTLCDWVSQCASRLEPLVKEIKKDLLRAPKIHTDDTTVPVQAKDKTKTGRLWVYANGGRDDPPCVVYEYTETRNQQGPLEFLRDYQGYLQADAYGGYDVLFEKKKMVEVACMAHARRKFFDVAKNSKNTNAAHQAIAYISKLYKVEKDAKELNDDDRKAMRQEKSAPILKEFKKWLDIQTNRVLPKSPLGQAIKYALNQWGALNCYLDHGMLSIDNNYAERLIKPLVIGRKNWLFAGSDKGAQNAAIIYSLIETCKQNKINPYEYLRDVLKRLPTCLNKNIGELLPYNWQSSINSADKSM